MQYRRYGKFNFLDLYPVWLGGTVMVVFGTMIIILHDNISESVSLYFLLAFMIIFSLIWFLVVLNHYNECFELEGNVINVIKHRKIYDRIIIPQNTVFIISCADMLTKDRTKGYELQNKYSVSVIKTMPLNEALEILHSNYVKKIW